MKKAFFASDFHLGIDVRQTSREREKAVVRWLEKIAPEAESIWLVGDVFEFFFEYQKVVPKGHVRLLGKLGELSDAGLPIHFFTGNHDLWMGRFFEDELGIPTYRAPILVEIAGKKCLIGHGDGLGPGDEGYKILKKIFTNPACRWAFQWLHPDLGHRLATFSSGRSRAKNLAADAEFLGPQNEWLIQFSEEKSAEQPEIDFFIFGHRHLPIDWMLKNGRSRYVNLGEWMRWQSFAVLDETGLDLRFFETENAPLFRNF